MQISSAILIGAGGTGQHLAAPLIRLLRYHQSGTDSVSVYDGDAFEAHNAERQIGVTGDKTDALDKLLSLQGLKAKMHPAYMTKERLTQIIRRNQNYSGALLVVAAVDNDATRKMCIETLMEADTDFLFISPGNSDATDPDASIKGNVLWFGRSYGQKIGINPMLLFPNIEKPDDFIPRRGGCMEHAPSTPQLISANALAAAYTLTVVQGLLDDQMPLEASHLFFNGRNMTLTAN